MLAVCQPFVHAWMIGSPSPTWQPLKSSINAGSSEGTADRPLLKAAVPAVSAAANFEFF